MTKSKSLDFKVQDNVGIITLDNAEKFNVVGRTFFEELRDVQQEVLANDTIKAILILANGKHFSAGIDLNYLNTASSEVMKERLVGYQQLYSFWETLPIPVVSAVNGKCIGSGVELILGCDIRIAGEDAKLSLPEVKIGLSPDMGGTTRLTRLVGYGQAKRLILSCDEISAEEALSIGLVERVVPTEKLHEEAFKYTKKIASYPSNSLRFAKKGIQVAQESSLAAGLMYEEAQSIYCCGADDIKQSINMILGK